MSKKFLTSIELEAGLVDGSNSTGTPGYVLSSTGTATSWIDPATIAVAESEQVHIACKNTSGVAISKGDPVYITGTVGTSFVVQIAKADASNSAKMPAVGLAESDLAINAEGYVIVSGVLKNITTDPLSTGDGTPSSNDTVYVKAGGGLTRTKPTGASNLIQNVGKVGRVQSTSAGSLAVSTIMRTNDVPNLNTGKIWVGSSTYTTESGVVHLDESNNRLGINNTSPLHALDVSGTIATDSAFLAVATLPSLTFIDTSGGGEIFTSSGSMGIKTGVGTPTTKMTILSGGNVGIGNTNPSYKLDVNGNVNASRYYSNNNTTFYIDPAQTFASAVLAGDLEIGWGSSSAYAMEIGQQRTGNGYAYLDLIGDETYQDYALRLIRNNTGANATSQLIHRGTGNLEIKTNESANIILNPGTGNVGIGTTSPSGGKLHIYATNTPIKFESSGLTLYNTYTNSNGNFGFVGSGNGVASGGNANDFGIQAVNNFVFATGGSTERMRIDSSGNVGIGGTPTHKLYVRNDVAATSDLDPTAIKLFNNSDGGSAIEFSNGVAGNSKLSFGVESTGAGTNDSYIGFSTSLNGATATERMRIGSAGQIGIGGANYGTSGQVLTSNGSGSAPSWQNAGAGSSNWTLSGNDIYNNNSGNVGIGTTSPAEKLEVSGNIKITETAATIDTDKFVVLDSGVLKYRTGSQVLSDIGALSTTGKAADSNLLDGIDSGSFLRSDANDTWSGDISTTSTNGIRFGSSNQTDSNDGYIAAGRFASGLNIVGTQTTAGTGRQIRLWGNLITNDGNAYWHAGNDGSGSGLDADTLDGNHASAFALSSHTHDDRYYTESEIQTFFNRGYIVNQNATNLAVGWYTIATNTGDRALGEFQIWEEAGSRHQSVLFNASHHFGQDNSNDITVLANSRFGTDVFRYIRIKEGGTYDGAALQIYIDNATNYVRVAITGANAQNSGWVLKDWVADATDPGDVSNWGTFTQKCIIDLDNTRDGGIATTGVIYSGGATTQYRNLTTADEGSGNGLDADTLDGQHASAFLTGNQTITLSGDVSGSGTTSISVTVNDDSHNHSRLYEKSTITYGDSYLQWTDLNGTGGAGTNGAAPGNPFSDWWHHIIMNHGNSGGYYVDIASCFHSDDIYFRRNVNGSLSTWREFIHTGNYTSLLDARYYTESEADSRFVNVSGDTMTGNLTLNNGGSGNLFGYDQYHYIKLRDGGANWITLGDYGGIRFFTGNNSTTLTEKVQIAPNGNVGVGTTSPSEKLEVSGSIKSGNLKIQNANGGRIGLNRNTATGAIYNNSYGAFQIQNNGGGVFEIQSYNSSGTSTGVLSMLESNGNVGIGTTSPAAKLHVGNGDGGSLFYINGQYNDVAFNGSTSGTNGVWSFINSATWDQTRFYVQDANNIDSRLTFRFTGNNGANEILTGTSTGKVGIGTTTPTERLEVAGNAILDASNANLKIKAGTTGTKGDIQWTFNTDSTVYASAGITYDNRATDGFLIDSGYPITLDYASSYIRFSNNGSEKMRINTSGNVGIGTTNPGSKLQIGDTATTSNVAVRAISQQAYQAGFEAYGSGQGTGYMYVGQSLTYGGGVAYNGDGTPAAFDSGTTGADKITFFRRENSTDTAVMWYGYNSNDVNFRGDVIAYATSDEDLKDNINLIPNSIEKIKALRGVTFEWNEKSNKEIGKKEIGVIAQDVEKVLPEIVKTRDNGYKAVDYQKLTAVLIEAVKEQQKQIDELKAIINGSSK